MVEVEIEVDEHVAKTGLALQPLAKVGFHQARLSQDLEAVPIGLGNPEPTIGDQVIAQVEHALSRKVQGSLGQIVDRPVGDESVFRNALEVFQPPQVSS